MDGVWGEIGTFAYKGIDIDSSWPWLLFKGFGRENSIQGFTFSFKQASLRLYAPGSLLGEESTCVAEEHGIPICHFTFIVGHLPQFEGQLCMQTLFQSISTSPNPHA